MAHGYLSSSAARAMRNQERRAANYQKRARSSHARRDGLARVIGRVLDAHQLGAYERITVNRAVLVDCLAELTGAEVKR